MATQKPRTRTNTSKSNQLTKFTFHWWMALILVGVVAVIGIVILRFSYASSVANTYADKSTGRGYCSFGPLYSGSRLQSSGDWCIVGYYQSGIRKFQRDGDRKCAFMRDGANSSKGTLLTADPRKDQWVTVYETTSCDV